MKLGMKMWIGMFFGIVASAVLAFLVIQYRDDLWKNYCLWRLERAQTLKEAKACLEAIASNSTNSPLEIEAFMRELGSERPRVTFWFFALMDTEKVAPSLIECFDRTLKVQDKVAFLWSHFVRWRLGRRLWDWLDAVALGLMNDNYSNLFGSVDSEFSFGENQAISNLRKYAVLWFIGLSSFSAATANITQKLLVREIIYDEKLGHCKAGSEAEPQPHFTSFRERKIPVPKVPVPGWNGPVPDLPSPAYPIFRLRMGSEKSSGILYDGLWPRPNPSPAKQPEQIDEPQIHVRGASPTTKRDD